VTQRTLLVESGQPLSGVGVFDLQGRVIYNDASAATNYRITLPAAPKGVYVVKTVLNGKISVNKIVL
jgi:hypothetical protein